MSAAQPTGDPAPSTRPSSDTARTSRSAADAPSPARPAADASGSTGSGADAATATRSAADVTSPTRSANTVNALIHLYRAEMGRLTTYRVRMDTTTSWAITSSALIATFALGNPQIPHEALLLLMFVNYFFLQLEARRFRAYEASRARIYLIERSFYPEVLGQPVDPRWTDDLIYSLKNPGITVNRLGALGWRLRRNYVWVYAAVLLAWVGKLYLAGAQFAGFDDFVRRAAIGTIPGAIVVALVAFFYAALVVLALGAHRVYPLGDDEARQVMEQTIDD
jgi:uncharacterized membrane protein